MKHSSLFNILYIFITLFIVLVNTQEPQQLLREFYGFNLKHDVSKECPQIGDFDLDSIPETLIPEYCSHCKYYSNNQWNRRCDLGMKSVFESSSNLCSCHETCKLSGNCCYDLSKTCGETERRGNELFRNMTNNNKGKNLNGNTITFTMVYQYVLFIY